MPPPHNGSLPPPHNGPLPRPATIFRLTASTQLRKVTGLQKRWKSAELSCSREIDVSLRGLRKRAWWPCGPAMQKFDSEIVGEIEELLKNVELGDADIYLRLYMIGKSPEKSRPVIMVCCSNPRVRTQAEEAIRESRIPKEYPEFALGASALPLEQPGLVRALAGMSGATQSAGHRTQVHGSRKRARGDEEDEEDKDDEPPPQKRQTYDSNHIDDLAPEVISYPVGRRLYVGPRIATGGVIIRIHERDHQLTVSHVLDDEPVPAPSDSDRQSLLEECHFDDMSEDDDEIDSATSNEPDGRPHVSQTPFDPHSAGYIPKHLAVSPYDSRNGPNPGLDYTLLPWDLIFAPHREQEYFLPNKIVLPDVKNPRTLCIEGVLGIPETEQAVAVATASSGVIRGVLVPTVVYFRNAKLPHFQRLHPVHLDGPVGLGDSGSAVVDQITGHLYGHIVRGAEQSTTAYIVAAAEVFDELWQMTAANPQLVSILKSVYDDVYTSPREEKIVNPAPDITASCSPPPSPTPAPTSIDLHGPDAYVAGSPFALREELSFPAPPISPIPGEFMGLGPIYSGIESPPGLTMESYSDIMTSGATSAGSMAPGQGHPEGTDTDSTAAMNLATGHQNTVKTVELTYQPLFGRQPGSPGEPRSGVFRPWNGEPAPTAEEPEVGADYDQFYNFPYEP
ncbi:predicted protein [Chaetomium globosum CBS 148.51]|uniref:Uncharacterized protein n=1 Tax=Chaetomium globosum (strain ATCC 6205 / CBS 148.51 / DSM 1962 / NBRC 6347 / NRRL 1970) TaxID=306901 RepID=Q2GRS0_CHAGB|nr:uncharacterized protein CHGG_09334 [Chaetomium globosum CBS 148.51]EAQ85320.1 predicted protein [Chaetomium globosum CBS 148.51]